MREIDRKRVRERKRKKKIELQMSTGGRGREGEVIKRGQESRHCVTS